jgi:cytochrome c553
MMPIISDAPAREQRVKLLGIIARRIAVTISFPSRDMKVSNTIVLACVVLGFTGSAAAAENAPATQPAADQAAPAQPAASQPATAAAPAPKAAGNADAGRRKSSMCAGCHNIAGYKTAFPVVYSVPKLNGQHAAYIVSALRAYKSGERKHPSMRAIAASLSDQDMADLAAFYSGTPAQSASR